MGGRPKALAGDAAPPRLVSATRVPTRHAIRRRRCHQGPTPRMMLATFRDQPAVRRCLLFVAARAPFPATLFAFFG